MVTVRLILIGLVCLVLRGAHAQSVTSLSRDHSILSGGLEMEVQGSGFTAGQSPRAIISMQYRTDAEVTFDSSVCTVTSSTRLKCELPEVTLPAAYTAPDVTRAENPRIDFDDDISFTLAITFNSGSPQGLKDLGMYVDPHLSDNDILREFNVFTERQVVLVGFSLTAAALTIDDYTVLLSDQRCDVITLNNTFLSCRLPLEIPTPEEGDYSIMIVEVGELSQRVGRITYRVPVFETPDPLPVLEYDPTDQGALLEATGSNLVVSLSANSYDVRVGQESATRISIAETMLYARGPSSSPRPSGMYPQHPNHYPQLVITVPKSNQDSFSYTYHVAYVRYVNHDYSQDSATPDGQPDTPGAGDSEGSNPGGNGDDNGDGAGDDSGENNPVLSDTSKWLLVGLAILLALSLISLLVFCVCCSRRPIIYDDIMSSKDSRRYLDEIETTPSQSRSAHSRPSHYSRPSTQDSYYPPASQLNNMYRSRYN